VRERFCDADMGYGYAKGASVTVCSRALGPVRACRCRISAAASRPRRAEWVGGRRWWRICRRRFRRICSGARCRPTRPEVRCPSCALHVFHVRRH